MTEKDVAPDPILLSPPDVGEMEAEYVLGALRSGWIAPAGPDLRAFEEAVAARVGASHAVALSSGTAALHLALVSWGVGPGDTVPVSTFTFAATVNAIRYVGADPLFVDCDEETGNISPQLLYDALSQIRSNGRGAPCIIAVDMFGKMADYNAITDITGAFQSRLLCDAAESFGSTQEGRAAGSIGDASAISFNGNKVMTTSGGGMLLTDDEKLATHVRKLSTQAREPVPHYEHTEVGFNYRLSNILAALGRAQLQRLDDMISRRREWRARYRDFFAQYSGVHILGGPEDAEDNCWLTSIIIDPRHFPLSSSQLSDRLAAKNIETRPVWKPMHTQPVFRQFKAVTNGASEDLFTRGLTLPSGSAMTDAQFDRILNTLAEAIAR